LPPTVAHAPLAPLLDLRALVRRSLVRHPELWLYAIALSSGLVLAYHAHHHHPAGSWLTEWRAWVVMVLATMLPVVAPQARRIALQSLWHRRHRAMAWFLLGYLAVWLAVGAVLVGVLVAIGAARPGPAVLAAALLAAAAWQVARPRRRVMRRCGALRPCAARGWQADRDCTDAGVRFGLRCTFTCGPLMLAMVVGHDLALMGGLLALLLSERARGPNPHRRAGRPLEAWCLVGFAAVTGLAAVA
jgi:predicted metal-binding membrane protein